MIAVYYVSSSSPFTLLTIDVDGPTPEDVLQAFKDDPDLPLPEYGETEFLIIQNEKCIATFFVDYDALVKARENEDQM